MTSPQTAASAAASASADADRVLKLTRRFDAPVEAVFAAWTDPAQLAQWWGPEGMTVPECDLDVREGGRWRTSMESAEGNKVWVEGVYREISPPERLVFTWSWDQEDGSRGHETVVTVEFRATDGGTELLLRQELFESAESCKGHEGGWTSSFVCLDQYLSGR